jgi:hypothetical protein
MSVSVLNSRSNIDVSAGYVFNGVYEEVVEYSQILVNIRANNTTDNNYTLLLEFSPDRINVVSNESTTVIFDYNKLLYITPISRFFRITLTALSNIQNLVIQTLYKNEIVYKAINQVSGFVVVDNLPEIQAVSGNVNITNTGFTSNIIASVPLEISNLGFTSNIIASVPLEISNLGFTSNIIASVPLDILTLPAITGNVNITNTFIYTREEPTNLTFHNNAGSNIGVVLFNGPRVLRALSITNTSTAVIYVHFYNMATIPTSGDSDIWLIPIAPNVVSNILNQTDHYFSVGISYRITTTYNNDVSPTANVCFLNGTYGY